MKEEIHTLRRQLAVTNDTTHIHYYDNRVVIVIENVPVDLRKVEAPVELFWYNRYNVGHKYTKVYLPPQEPGIDDTTGELTVDLLENERDTSPTIHGIFPRHLSLVRNSFKMQRR